MGAGAKVETKREVSAAIKRRLIGQFLTRSDNATCLPGKRDTMKFGTEHLQRYILNDSIGALHSRYNFEKYNDAMFVGKVDELDE